MNKLTQALMEELTVEYVKVGPLQIPESVVISWVIMVLVVLGSILLTRNLKVDHISKRQAVLEMAYTAGKNFFEGLLGKEGACYVPYLMTVAIYIACSNLIGVFGVKPPTKDLDVTAALALMSIVLIEGSGIRARGGVGFLKSLAAPTPVMTPMNILETTTVKIDNDFFFTFKDSDLKIAVPKRYYSVVSDGFRCKMGVRPMDVLVGGADSQGTPEKITTFENLGDERRIGISVGESLLMLITSDETRYHAGDVIKLEVRGDKTHLFDLETGARIKEK